MPLDVTPAGEGYTGTWRRVPRGPVVAIAPFNFPLNLVAHKVAPALACGASIVLKPAPQTPLIALELEAIVRESGFPEHALQVLPCDVPVAEKLVTDDRFATLSFTGSAAVGWHLKSIAGKKRVLLELGGNAAAIVHDDADLDFAAKRVVSAAFGYAGQVCIKVQRLYVHEPVAEAFTARVVEAARALVPRAPLEDGILSCLIDDKSAVRISSWVGEAEQRGARALVSAERDENRLGAIVLAFDGDGRGAKVVDEEVFGPVLTVHRYAKFEDALAMADATRYGLQAGLFTDSRARVEIGLRAPARRRARRRRRAVVPRRLDALRRHARLRPRPRGRALRDRRDDRAQAPGRAESAGFELSVERDGEDRRAQIVDVERLVHDRARAETHRVVDHARVTPRGDQESPALSRRICAAPRARRDPSSTASRRR